MMKSMTVVAAGFLLASTAAFAQTATPKTAAECDTIWKTADVNADGKLDATEMETNKALIPQSMQSGSAADATGSSSDTKAADGSTKNDQMATGSTTGAPAGDMTMEAFKTACTAS